MYQPNWLQHEFMHHLFTLWSEFQLEVTRHQWFDRNTWPADLVGNSEPDYDHEALTKRILAATPAVDPAGGETWSCFGNRALASFAR